MENTLWLFMTICPNKPWLTDKWVFCWEDLPVEKPTLEMSSICIPDFWKERPKWARNSEEVIPTLNKINL